MELLTNHCTFAGAPPSVPHVLAVTFAVGGVVLHAQFLEGLGLVLLHGDDAHEACTACVDVLLCVVLYQGVSAGGSVKLDRGARRRDGAEN